ncbi:MAG: ubiquinone biosynthesis regulatory protein kinase UbiB [Candidatus Competibacterales bacterium]
MAVSFARLKRLWTIHTVLVRHGLDDLLLTSPALRSFPFLRHLLPWNWWRRRDLGSRGERVRRALEDLGPIFVKFGQMLSTRRDLLPADLVEELARLQDRVPPFPAPMARELITRALGQPPEAAFAEFSDVPMASASIAQVHAAKLFDGRQVVVKVVRPGIERTIRHDLALMYLVADLIARYSRDGRRLRPREVVAEYEKTILDELDLVREAATASQLKRNFAPNPELLYIPEIHWPLVRHNVLVMERIYGVPVNAVDQLKDLGVDLKKLSRSGVEIFFLQVLRDNFFHADMHPGNIFIDVTDPLNPRYIAIDFGIVGTLRPEDQYYLAENSLAFFRRDYRRVAELHLDSGWIPPNTRVDELESAIRTVCEPIFDKPLGEISFGQLLFSLFQVARRFEIELQPQLVLLQKTLLHIEGLGRQLDPDLDVWRTARPILERWMRQRVGVRRLLRRLQDQLPRLVEEGPEIPTIALDVLRRADKGELQVGLMRQESQWLQGEIRRANRYNVAGVAGSGLLIAAAVLLSGAGDSPLMPAALVTAVAGLLAGLGVALLVTAWNRSGD